MAASVVGSAASLAGSAMYLGRIAKDFLPDELQHWLDAGYSALLSRFSSNMTIYIDEYDAWYYNKLHEAADMYLGSKVEEDCGAEGCFRVTRTGADKENTLKMDRDGDAVVDVFQGIRLKWALGTRVYESNFPVPSHKCRSEVPVLYVTFHKKHKDTVFNSYLPHVLRQSEALRDQNRRLQLHTLSPYFYEYETCSHALAWDSVLLNHPATFQTLAMDPDIKTAIIDDLDRFVRRRDLYRNVGKAWKRGYLLYGPPGTGKSTLIAAMANYLNFSIYDLELSGISRNSDLRKLIACTENRSILVIEDIDCTDMDLGDRGADDKDEPRRPPKVSHQLSLSALLNFIDGIWSSCGDERIIIFTTNHKEKLDPALLRPGRMDMHILMSYCCPKGFRVLAKNYLALEDHPLFPDIDALIDEVDVTPAEVAEELLRHDEPEICLSGLVHFLRQKRTQIDEEKAPLEDEKMEGSQGSEKTRKKKSSRGLSTIYQYIVCTYIDGRELVGFYLCMLFNWFCMFFHYLRRADDL